MWLICTLMIQLQKTALLRVAWPGINIVITFVCVVSRFSASLQAIRHVADPSSCCQLQLRLMALWLMLHLSLTRGWKPDGWNHRQKWNLFKPHTVLSITMYHITFISIVKPTRCTIFEFIEYHSTCFGRSFRPSSGVQDWTYSVRYMSYRLVDCLPAG